MGHTSVQVRDETWERLDERKERGDSFDEVITELLNDSKAESVKTQVQQVRDQATEAEAGGGKQ